VGVVLMRLNVRWRVVQPPVVGGYCVGVTQQKNYP
jgi:hypothetical protein